MPGILFGAVADDDTGATDLAGMLAGEGVRTIQVIDVPEERRFAAWLGDAEAVVVATGTRALAPREAYDRTAAAVRLLEPTQPRTYAIKYCSTFDSTAEGNIGPSIDAALDVLGERFTVALPALPVNGRTTYMGYHFVHRQLLSDSPMRLHPLTPMTNPNLVSHLAGQTRRKVGLTPHTVVREGAARIRESFAALEAEGVGISILDCISDADLAALCEAIADLKVVTGSSAPGIGLPRVWRARGWWQPAPAAAMAVETPKAGCLIVAGSCSVATRGQNEWAEGRGMPSLVIDPRALLEGSLDEAGIAARVSETLAGGGSFLLKTASTPEDVARVQTWAAARGAAASETGLRIAYALASLCRRILEREPPAGLIIAGGETSGAFCRTLRFGALAIGRNIEPGVPLCRSLGEVRLPVVLKSGNFGSPDFYGRAEAAIRGGGAL